MLLSLLQRADVFWARPTYLSPTPRKETRKRAVYQIRCTHTQEGPWHAAKIIADADDICSRKTGLRTFWKCFLEKKDEQSLLLEKGHAVTLQILFLREVFWWQKLEKKHFPVLFSGNVAQLMNFMGLLTFPFKWRGQSFPSSTVWKRRSCYKRELVRQHACDMWIKISCPATVSLL